MQKMNENPSKNIKEISEDKEIKNSSEINTDSLFMILFLLPKKIFFSISKLLVLQCNDHPSPFDKLINIEFPAFVFTILVSG